MNIEIKSDGSVEGTQLLLDSKKINGVKSFSFSAASDGEITMDISLILTKEKEYFLPKNFAKSTLSRPATGICDNTEIF